MFTSAEKGDFMKRKYSLDFFKLLFAYLVALSHFGTAVSPNGDVLVHFFYVISGFFLARKFYTKSYSDQAKAYNQWNYTLDHVKTLYPHYLFSLVVLAGYFLVVEFRILLSQPSLHQVNTIIQKLADLIPEFLLLQNAGPFNGGINYPLWQLCALLIGGYFVYALLCFNEKLSRELIFPAGILMIQALLVTGVDIWSPFAFFHLPLLRAFSPLCIGVLTYYFTTTDYYTKIKEQTVAFNLISVFSVFLIFVLDDYHNLYLITFVIVLLAIFDENSWINRVLNRRLFRSFGNFSYAIYLNHALIAYVLKRNFFPRIPFLCDHPHKALFQNITYLIAISVYSVITLSLVNRFKKAKGKAKTT